MFKPLQLLRTLACRDGTRSVSSSPRSPFLSLGEPSSVHGVPAIIVTMIPFKLQQSVPGTVACSMEELPAVPLEASWSSCSGLPSFSGASGDVADQWPLSCMSTLPLQVLGWQRTKTLHRSKHLTTIHNLPLLHRPTRLPQPREAWLPTISLWSIAATVAPLRLPLFARSVALKSDTSNWWVLRCNALCFLDLLSYG